MEPLRLDHVPPAPGPRDEVRRITAGEEAHLCIVSPSIWGTWTHWDNGRTICCTKDKAKCDGCIAELPARWKGYIHCICLAKKKPCFLELTPLLGQLLLTQAPSGQPLRGLQIQVSRGKGAKARLRLTIYVGRAPEASLPAPRDPEPTLRLLWAMPDRRANSLADPMSRFSRLDNSSEQSYN